jgi:hypothetical protein
VVLAVVLLMRRLLMRGFSAGLQSSFHPWAEAGPLKGPRSRWTGIPPVSRTPTEVFHIKTMKKKLKRRQGVEGKTRS